jgi:acyl transferase domain-containing protein/NADPH:quinone reductase-like Zn-dependent oxidoreductase/acyl carrier protein/SAM-dependent methyltransferase
MTASQEIAIVGYAARLPGARNAQSFWALLRSNRCSVTWITPDRFPTQGYYHPTASEVGRSYTFAAGVIDDPWGFDAAAFGMSPREAEQVDPQHRHLLEVAYDSLAHAGIRPSSLAGSHTGVYVGGSSVDYAARFISDPSVADVHMMTGNSISIMANRISYTLDLRGPSIALDTACSSSLVALHLAAEAIRCGTIDTAIVGGVNLLLSPFSYVGFSRASMLSPTGLCRPFDADADGYVRSEGAIVVVLRSVAAAHKARNRIHGVIVGSGVNQDGRTTGLSLPSAASQRQLLDDVYGTFAVDPADLTFVEAHGTGTRVGDPIEADALGKGLAQKRTQPLPIGSVKSNVGHLEPVSGLAGLLKSVLAMNHDLVPATLHQKAPSPDIPFDELNLRVVSRNWRPPDRRGPWLAGINSFGFGGTNAHAIVRSDAKSAKLVYLRNSAPLPPLLLTTHSADALPELAASYDRLWPEDPNAAGEFIGASAHLRDLLPHRVLIRGGTSEEIRHHLRRFATGEKSTSILTGQAVGNDMPVAFLFSGNGAQWAGMGRDAWQANVHFREALKEVDGHFGKVQKWSIVEQLFSDDLTEKLRQATYSQPLLLAMQVATVRALEEAGLTPTATLGHSVGEISAAWAAGALSLEQAIDVVIARSRHQESARGMGGMAALMLSDREARRFIETAGVPGIEVAAVNSWRSVTVSGPIAEIEALVGAAARSRISARRLDLDYPFHSALIDSVRGPLLRELDGVKPLALRRKMVSSVTADFVKADTLGAEHWWRNVREPVQFEAAFGRLLAEGLRIFIEVGPKPILSSYVRDILREAGLRGASIETMNEAMTPETTDPIERSVSRTLLAGGRVDVSRFFGPPPPTAVDLPLYPWRHTPFMVRPTIDAHTIFVAPAHPLLGRRPRLDSSEWYSTIDPVLFPWLEDHKVGGVAVFPAAGYVEVMLAAGQEALGEGPLELRDLDIVRPLVFDGDRSFETLVRLSSETGLLEFQSRRRGGTPEWSLNARGVVRRSPIAGREVRAPALPPGTVVVTKPKVYESARALGFTYGPAFQRARQVGFPHPKRGIAALDAPACDTPDWRVMDLTGFDTSFHALFASEEAGVADMPMKRMLPIHFGCIRVFKAGAAASVAVARTLRQSPSSILVDFELYDGESKLVLQAENVRLVEAPQEVPADPLSLSYRTASWRMDRAGTPSPLEVSVTDRRVDKEAASMGEASLLLEAACLRAAWDALIASQADGAKPIDDVTTDQDESASTSAAFLRSALLWHLELRGLAYEEGGRRKLADNCEVPDVHAIVRSLTTRHPTMAAEAASVARINETLRAIISDDEKAVTTLGSSHWRQLGSTSRQGFLLRTAVLAELEAAISACDRKHLLRVLMIGAEQVTAACELVERFPNLEIVVTDSDPDRLDQARVSLGDDFPRVRSVPWASMEEFASGTFDLALAIDSLSEVAAAKTGLGAITRVLRPGGSLLAAELTPSLFWDIVRATRPTWWARSANVNFPVGALLTAEEWAEELQSAGFSTAFARPLHGEARIGVLLHGVIADARVQTEPADTPVFLWEGDEVREDALGAYLQRHLAKEGKSQILRDSDSGPGLESGSMVSSVPPSGPTDVVLMIDATHPTADPASLLSDHLVRIADRCRRLAAAPARLWVVLDFGQSGSNDEPLSRPLWCAISSALRVAQNEYSGLQIRCLGLAGKDPSVAKLAADELRMPDVEREIFFDVEGRTVFRIQRAPADPLPVELPASDMAITMADRQRSGRDGPAWITQPRSEPGPHEVEIEVAAAGLNFRDVMWNLRLLPEEALEDGYSGPSLGMECAGTVVSVGAEVTAVQRGDRVVAFAPHAFSSHVIAPSFAVVPLPGGMTFEAASTIPVAFLTAYYSLVHLGQVGPGQVVLVHGGAGAVGLAAIQIARHCGASVIATAGSEEKRAFLRDYGAELTCNSRALSFVEEVLAHTQGKGVDIVLNSLAGEAMARSMDCLRPFGRFIELGKRDFYANTHLGLRPLRRNLSYFGVDVDQLIGAQAELAHRLFKSITQLFAEGELLPLPYRTFAGKNANDAFRLMQRSGHIGKIVINPAERPTSAGFAGSFPVDRHGVHIVIGGTSGFGLATAEWLARRGASRLVLASRSGQSPEADAAKIEALRRRGIQVVIERVDVGELVALQQLLHRVQSQGPIKGIVHAAMVIDDRLIEGMDRTAIEAVLRPKVSGALNLERTTAGLDLDYLLLYSSATTLFGNPGQFNYVAANAFMEGLARRMRARGVPALAIGWGGIEDAGYLARNIGTNPNLKKRFASNLITTQTALDGLDWVHDGEGRQIAAACAIARIDWAMARRELAAVRTPVFEAVSTATAGRQATDAAATLERLRGMPMERMTEALLDIVVEEIARVLRLPPKEIDRHRPLAEIGMDSLMMLELRTTVEDALQIELPMMSLSSGITPADVARRMAPLVAREKQEEAVPGTIVALSASHFAAEAEATGVDEAQAAVSAVLERVRELKGPL